jgi:hypothetical protein
MTAQYLRKIGLIVTSGSKGLDLSEMRIKFNTYQAIAGEAPNTAMIRVYNLSDTTAKSIATEFQAVQLEAGYQGGPFARIFSGTITQVWRGRESAIDSYVDIAAADGDAAYNYAVCNATLAAGATPEQQVKAIGKALEPHGVTIPDTSIFAGTDPAALARGKALSGMAMGRLTEICNSAGVQWSIVNGQVIFSRVTGYRPGTVVVLNAATGLIGFPEQTAGGINMRCLLNPYIEVGGRVKLDNAAINTTTILQQGIQRTGEILYATPLDADGIYTSLVVEHGGDTRGNDWFTDISALPVDPSASADESVQAYGGPA